LVEASEMVPLSMLECKGRVRKLPTGTACGGGCRNCDPGSIEIYEWVDTGAVKVVDVK
jgi:hypothetical protein